MKYVRKNQSVSVFRTTALPKSESRVNSFANLLITVKEIFMRNQPVDISDLRIRRYTVEKYSSELSADQDLGLVGKDLFISGNVIKPGEAF